MTLTPTDMRIEIARRGLKQADVAQLLDIDDAVLSRYLNGRRVPAEGMEQFSRRFLAACETLSPSPCPTLTKAAA